MDERLAAVLYLGLLFFAGVLTGWLVLKWAGAIIADSEWEDEDA